MCYGRDAGGMGWEEAWRSGASHIFREVRPDARALFVCLFVCLLKSEVAEAGA